jgi:hypothetical protein
MYLNASRAARKFKEDTLPPLWKSFKCTAFSKAGAQRACNTETNPSSYFCPRDRFLIFKTMLKGRRYPKGQLFIIAKNRLFSDLSDSKEHVCRLLRTAVAVEGCMESDWLLKKVCYLIPDDEYLYNDFCERRMFIQDLLSGEDECVRSAYYFCLASLIPDEKWFEILRIVSEQNIFAPAMSLYASKISNAKEKLYWAQKAAELGDPDGLFMMAAEDKFLLTDAANKGSIQAMKALNTLKMRARADFYCGDTRESYQTNSYQEMFEVGRELVDFERVWLIRPHVGVLKCIDFYTRVCKNSQSAALQTVYLMRPVLGRDVARVIAKMVYNTRNYDAECWDLIETFQRSVVPQYKPPVL